MALFTDLSGHDCVKIAETFRLGAGPAERPIAGVEVNGLRADLSTRALLDGRP